MHQHEGNNDDEYCVNETEYEQADSEAPTLAGGNDGSANLRSACPPLVCAACWS